MNHRGYITVTDGPNGWLALHVVDGEPYQTGVHRYALESEAWEEATEWARMEELPLAERSAR